MIVKVLVFVLLLTTLNLHAQSISDNNTNSNLNSSTSQSSKDDLTTHLSAAETYQISGDLINAAVENRVVIGIALQQTGNIAIEEGKYQDAIKFLTESKNYYDNAQGRINLAVAYLRNREIDKALEEAQTAVNLDETYTYARYILGNIYFTKEDYKSALPELEKVFIQEQSFDVARALGLTYLHLKQLERAKLLFEEMQTALKTPNAQLRILFGQAFEQTGYALEAEREFKLANTIDPKQTKASFYLGYVILRHGGSERLAEAGKAFEQELKLTPNDFYTNFFAGVVASSENKHELAISYLQKAVKMNPKSGEAYLFFGQSQFELNNLAEAEKSLRRAIELEKTDTKIKSQARRTHFILGRLLLKTNRKEEAQKELEIAKNLQQESLSSARDEINRILGEVVSDTSDLEDVKQIQNSAVDNKRDLSPKRTAELKQIKTYLSDVLAQSFHNLGVIAIQSNKVEEALENFAYASQWKPDFLGLNRNWGIVSFRAGKFKEAILPLSSHLKLNPDDTLIRQMLGASYNFTGNFKQTVETLKPIATALSENPELAYFYGISLVQMENFAEAKPFFDSLATSLQKDAEGLFYAAQGFMILGDYERAVKEFSTILNISPNKTKANFFKGQSLIRLNRFEEAEKSFRNELQLNPIDESSKYHLALTLIERRIKNNEAVSLLKEAIDLKYDYADAHYQLGKIYIEKGETEKAIESLEIAVRSDDKKDYIHYQLSIAYRKASREEDAARELQIYQKLKSENRNIKIPQPMGKQ